MHVINSRTKMNLELLFEMNRVAKEMGIDWFVSMSQNGRYIASSVWMRNNTGEEKNVHVQVNIDDESNVAYVFLQMKDGEAYEDLRNRLTDQNGVEEFDSEMYGFKGSIRCYNVNSVCRIVNNGDIRVFVDSIFAQVKECTNVLSKVIY